MDFQRTRAILSCMPAPPALRALIVEDDVSTAEFLRVGLAYEGYAVEVCGDGILETRPENRQGSSGEQAGRGSVGVEDL
jgi:hypothetical protein